ncbi:MAG: DNA polymerase III subunit gamma/tau, partial [Mycobacterium sp.]
AAPAPARSANPAEQQIAEEQRVAAERAEEEDMLAEAAHDEGKNVPRRDPEEVALELLKTELGARPIGE